jgi:hypothetical protein
VFAVFLPNFEPVIEDKETGNNKGEKNKIQGFFAPLRMTDIFLTITAFVKLP